ncbi:2-dehydropantoate 2-reductase [Pullulanibacillus pueri]|uniref:2-dehydropantoate 2-reductase n=1 Tax=Pullulanibacillus pueri TaxID=1437324 RepID=A0A8J2ZZR8_9BACL|nr:ketopantoate reductase family protein [Pullulanibacillus pueri]MBM7681680.1 2-dehydropantoate 2-reductase [Pullulanibacillus pueri]GGH87002.1 2-dehydropantoate 2-reductase [Pullulanibacillus pueri]
MKIVVLGAGALGSYFGLRMHEIGHEITFLVREGRAQQLKENGLKIMSPKGDLSWKTPHYCVDVSEIEACDLLVVGLKGYHLQGASEQLRQLADKGATVLPVLNGIEHLKILQDIFGEDRVLGGIAYIIATLNEAGHVVHTGDQHAFLYGMIDKGAKDTLAQRVCAELSQSAGDVNLDLAESEFIYKEMWKKYVFISAFSGVTTTSRLPIGPIRNTPETLELGKKVVEEMVALAEAYDVHIDDGVEETMTKLLYGFPDEATSSMHQDFRNQRPLEVDALFGAALRMGRAKGLALPHVETLHALLKPYEYPQGKK